MVRDKGLLTHVLFSWHGALSLVRKLETTSRGVLIRSTIIALACSFWASPHGTALAAGFRDPQEPVGALIVNHKNFKYSEKADVQKTTRVARLRVFFAHSAEGENIVSGIESLRSGYAIRYPLRVESVGNRPIGPSRLGKIYEINRGDPGSEKKVQLFEEYVAEGWRLPIVDVALNTFGAGDQEADIDRYIQSMLVLEETNRGTTFLYATIPLTTDDPDSNARRELFNFRLRRFAAANNKPLLDIADIESYSAKGKPATCTSKGHVYRCLNTDYVGESGSLNGVGSQRLAKGLISLLELAAVR